MDEVTSVEERRAAVEPVGRDGARVEITERKAWSLGAGPTLIILLLLIAALGVSIWGFVSSVISIETGTGGTGSVACIVACVLVWVVVILLLTGVTVLSPGHTRVIQFFGRYIGTLRRPGLNFVVPMTVRTKVSARVRNFETNTAKVNDYNGNPINIAAIIVWQVADTAKATFSVEEYVEFIKSQSESALRHVATQHPYDSPVDGRVSLRGSTDEVSAELAEEVARRVAVAGLEIIETRISSLSYAPEIAQAMLQRQQASAIVDARETIVEGAVSMVQQALDELEKKEIVDLDPERRAAMVSNLLVVLCSDGNATPVINAGGLYQ